MQSVPLHVLDKRLDRMARVLGLLPWDSDRLSPAELMTLWEGDQERWNRVCELAAWMVVMFTSVVPKFGKGRDWRTEFKTLKQFLEQNRPPGYQPRE